MTAIWMMVLVNAATTVMLTLWVAGGFGYTEQSIAELETGCDEDSEDIHNRLKEHAAGWHRLTDDHNNTARRGERHEREIEALTARVAELESTNDKLLGALIKESSGPRKS